MKLLLDQNLSQRVIPRLLAYAWSLFIAGVS